MRGDERYSRQVRFEPIGESGQAKISSARIGLIGLGALGTVIAEQLVRAGVGSLRMIDRDLVELSNLQRQTLYDEDDVRGNLPKAVAATHRLQKINSNVTIEGVVDDLNGSNVEEWLDDLDLVMDGLDNFETRFVLNDCLPQGFYAMDLRRGCGQLWPGNAGPSRWTVPAMCGGYFAGGGYVSDVRHFRRHRSNHGSHRVGCCGRGASLSHWANQQE